MISHELAACESYRFYAVTIEALRAKCGSHGEAAVADVEWGAVCRWLLNDETDGVDRLGKPKRAVNAAIAMAREHDRARLGYPHWRADAFRLALNGLSPTAKNEIAKIIAETRANWENAGRPGLTAQSIKATQQYINALQANGIRPSTIKRQEHPV
jgi:hypothetical protein